MTHLISPISYRLGKSSLWKTNSIINYNTNALLPSAASSFNGLSLILKHKLRRKRLFMVKTTVYQSLLLNTLNCRILFMPRIKTKPRSDSKGVFSRNVLYKPLNWNNSNFLVNSKSYVDQRRLKIFKFSRLKNKHINKWLTRRMFRGSLRLGSKIVKRTTTKRIPLIKNWQKRYIHYNKFIFTKYIKFNIFKHFKLPLKIFKKLKWSYRWWISRSKVINILNNNKLSNTISNILNQRINIKALNIFNYMAVKQMIGFRSHQNHLWNKRFRRNRFYYDNYFDIVNSFFILSLIKNSESLLLDILRMMMPRIRKIRRFMFFLDSILKNMIQIQDNFSCFRITITGKIRGGTERTKTLSVGFGLLPYQSINIEGSVAFVSYPHKFGEFGIKLIMNRTFLLKKIKPVEDRWLI